MANKKYVTLLLLAFGFFVFGGIFYSKFIKGNNSQNTVSPTPTQQVQGETASVKEFTVDGTNFAFNPSEIKVKQGDIVRIIFKDDDGQHNLVIDGYNVSTDLIGPGSQDTIEFVADTVGEFEYYCSVGSHRELGMSGKLVVE